MIGLVVKCARKECGKEFTKTTHNQKYCESACCKAETNARIMEKYHERVAIKRGVERVCNVCESVKLSRYNPNKACASCELKKKQSNRGEASDLLASVTWL